MIPSSEISSFRPRRAFLGYERKETDEFLEHVAELLERAGKRIEDSEAELARHREKEQSLNEALLAVAKTADAIKRDARSEAETIRAGALELDQFVATTRSQLSAFLRETLEKLATIAQVTRPGEQVELSEEEEGERGGASEVREEVPSPVGGVESQEDAVEPPETDGSIFERLKPYRAEASGTPARPVSERRRP
jgi:hypothetical protein